MVLLEAFGRFGEKPGQGITRLLYDESWLAFQQYVMDAMNRSGMRAAFDAVGNVVGHVQGTLHTGHPIVTGSHGDTVRCAGQMDGQYGIAAGILAVGRLLARYGPPERSLQVVSFAEEEGSRFATTFWGSKAYTGRADWEAVKGLKDAQGRCFADAMRRAGFAPEGMATQQATVPQAFVELHVEQGDALERHGARVGIVSGIVAQRRFSVALKGRANHAGTSAMACRRDALMGFARISQEAHALARQTEDALTLTFGSITVHPNTPNVIPGEVAFTVDCRHIDEGLLEDFCVRMRKSMEETAGALGLGIAFSPEDRIPAVALDRELNEQIERLCRQRGVPCRRMHSGAGHDAQILAAVCPSTLIFVPSVGGVSHSPEEYTKPEDLALGVDLLEDMLYCLAYESPRG